MARGSWRIGQVKVVHRNLIMPVNFLPLHDAVPQDETQISVVSSSVDLDDERELAAVVSVESADYRTRVWVSVLPSESLVDVEQSDLASAMPDCASLAEAPVNQSCRGPSQSDLSIDMARAANGGGADSDLSLAVPDTSLDPILCSETQAMTDTVVGDVEVRSRARSRAGRLLRPTCYKIN